MKTINYKMLVAMNACSEGLQEFVDLFGTTDDVEVNVPNVIQLSSTHLQWFVLENFEAHIAREYTKRKFEALSRYMKVVTINTRFQVLECASHTLDIEYAEAFVHCWKQQEEHENQIR